MSSKPASEVRKIAAFDFDGTLTYTDSFTAFLIHTVGSTKFGACFIRHPTLLLHYLKTKDRGALKSRLLYRLLGPISKKKLEERVRSFVKVTGHSLFRPDAIAEWDRQGACNRQRVIVTASPEILVKPFGALIGADKVIGTRLGFSSDGRLLPDLDGANCRGEEKMCRLRGVFGNDIELETAYGDTAGDHEMLAAARHAHYRVFTSKPSNR